jgi:SsrA-binding protein
MKEVIENKRARFDYEFLEKFEAGIVLTGQEVKAIKLGRMNLTGSYVLIRNNEVFLINAHISPYQAGNTPENYEPTRARKLLLKKDEIRYLAGKSKERGLTLTPTRVYSKKEKIKLEFAVSRGKKKADKKESIKKRETEREMRSFLKRG